jgi:PAP_fibrillin
MQYNSACLRSIYDISVLLPCTLHLHPLQDVRRTASAGLGDQSQLRDSIKKEIMVLAATTNRGQLATQDEKDAVADLVYQLENLNPTPVTTDTSKLGGTWDLIFSDVQPFRSSPFFMAIGELFSDVSNTL